MDQKSNATSPRRASYGLKPADHTMSDVSSSSVSFHDAKDSSGSLSTVKDADAVSMPELPGNLDSSVGSCNDQSSLKYDLLS